MRKVKPVNDTDQLIPSIIKGIQEKKGKDIVKLDLRQLQTRATDVFIVCHGDSSTQVDAIYKSIEEEVHKSANEWPWGLVCRATSGHSPRGSFYHPPKRL